MGSRLPPGSEQVPPSESLERVLAAAARGLVDAQHALDAHAEQRLRRWEEEGLPPMALGFTGYRLFAPVRFACTPGGGPGVPSVLTLRPASGSPAWVSFTLRQRPAPTGGDGGP